MASFNLGGLQTLEKEIGHCHVANMPLNLNDKIDEGTSAYIYKLKLRGKEAAVKLLKKQFSKLKILEVSIKLRKLNDANVIRFRGYSVRPSALLFEFCEVKLSDMSANNISQLITIFNENGHFVLSERLDLVHQAAKGLRYLHSHHIIHRDFKSANLLVTGNLENIVVKVADFDDLLLFKETIASTATCKNIFTGMTLAYVAPELCNHSVNRPSFQTDVYAFAITVYEMLANVSSPWSNVLPVLNDTLLLNALCKDVRPPINEIIDLYKENCNLVINLVCNAWHSNPDERKDMVKVINYSFSI